MYFPEGLEDTPFKPNQNVVWQLIEKYFAKILLPVTWPLHKSGSSYLAPTIIIVRLIAKMKAIKPRIRFEVDSAIFCKILKGNGSQCTFYFKFYMFLKFIYSEKATKFDNF